MTKDELRRAFPKEPYWWIELQTAFERDGVQVIEIGSGIPRDGFEAAVLHKLFPTLYPHITKHKAAATEAFEKAIRPWRSRHRRPSRRTGGKRGRPSLAPVLAAIAECREGRHYYNESRLASVVLGHLKPRNRSERRAVLLALEETIERQGGCVDWGEWFRTIRQAIKAMNTG